METTTLPLALHDKTGQPNSCRTSALEGRTDAPIRHLPVVRRERFLEREHLVDDGFELACDAGRRLSAHRNEPYGENQRSEPSRTFADELRHLVQLALRGRHHAELVLARYTTEESRAEIAVQEIDAGAENREEVALKVRAGDVDKVAVLLHRPSEQLRSTDGPRLPPVRPAHLEELGRLVVQVRVVPDRVKDNVERLVAVLGRELLDEVRLFVVEDVVGRETLDELARGRRAGRDNVGAVGFRELQSARVKRKLEMQWNGTGLTWTA